MTATTATAATTTDTAPPCLETLFGDPRDPANPLGDAAVLAADERGELLARGEELLRSWGFHAEFVPTALGGRLGAADALVRRLRPVFRRDVSLGLGHGVTSLMAAVNVWTAGGEAQRRRTADLLLAGGRLSVAYHEPAHGNDLMRNAFRADPHPGGYRLSGTKQLINNIERADAAVLFARTDDAGGPRDHSLLLLEPGHLAAPGLRRLPRTPTSGVRGVRLGGLRADDATVPADTLLGRAGGGAEHALRSFQITRAVLPGLAVAPVDTALRTVTRFARERRLYGTTVAALPHAASVLAAAYADLLAADALATTAARALHLLPGQASLHTATTKYLVPRLLADAMAGLSVVLGARFYLREGPHALFGKHLRDLPVIALGHAGATACLLTVIPQLPGLARRAWLEPAQPPAALFEPAAPLGALDPDALALTAAGRDDLGALLLAAPDWPELRAEPALTAPAAALRELAADSGRIPPRERGPLAGPETFALAERCALLHAAAACLGTWRAAHRRGDPFLGDTAWLRAALLRLTGRLHGRPGPLPEPLTAALTAELAARTDEGRSLDLDRVPVLT
ncbi:acyl-CoA dehydrogenase [Streptomyces sp. NBC_00091]|uniref:acyl-CoA dehydrogenase n=1 Tax=Streptomyces sp. NBC_00091 TaxID=2975648 RepID=UPI0022540AC1|nr:acyl-CoA dehydrogenase [Streptomyces sp. NBC_00091]MCX5381004.1 acyl-CoA dehydrogenase [Streptomyces sp. NBC_00091]